MFNLEFKDIHTFGNISEVRPKHLSLELKLNFERKIIQGDCVLTLNYAAANQTPRFLDLDVMALKIKSVKDEVDGRSFSFILEAETSYQGGRLRIDLAGKRPERVRIGYETSPNAGALQWLAPENTTSRKYPFLFTQSQAILARSWIPCMDSPGIRVTYDAVIRVPDGIVPVMSAFHKEQHENGAYRFEMPLAIPPYLIALAAGELKFKALSDRTGVYAEPAVLEKAAWEFAQMEEMVQAAESLYGSYRWERWDAIVLPPSFPFGGMENPLLTFVTPTLIAGDRSLVSVMAHELAHSWSGNLVTNATWSDFWLNEGFTTYFERRIVESLYGEEVAEMHRLLGQRDLHQTIERFDRKNQSFDTILYVNLEKRNPDDAFSDIPYEKGSNFLALLEKHFGRPAFDAFLKNYFDTHAFRSMTTERFLDYLDKELFKGDKQAWKVLKVDQWVYEGGVPDNLVIPKSDRFQKTRAASKAFAESGRLDGVDKGKWTTSEWLDFLNTLPKKLSKEQMDALDNAFRFSQSGNSEILFAWLMIAVRSTYEASFPALEHFLIRQGRRKFLTPLYEGMQENPNTRELGKSIYAKARSGYHPIAVSTVDNIMK